MKVIQEILSESEKSERVAKVLDLFRKCSKKYFGKIPKKHKEPNVKIGTAYGKFGHYNHAKNEMWINKDLFTNERGLKSTVYHETIHFYDYDYPSWHWKINKGHGDFFKEYMAKINSGEGDSNLINIVDTVVNKIDKTEKEFTVYFFKYEGSWRATWAIKDQEPLRSRIIKIMYDRPGAPTELLVCQSNDPTLRVGTPMRVGSSTLSYWKVTEEIVKKNKCKCYPFTLESEKEFVVFIAKKGSTMWFWWDWEEDVAVKKAMRTIIDKFEDYDILKLKTNSILWQRPKRLSQTWDTLWMVSSNIKKDVDKAVPVDKSDFR